MEARSADVALCKCVLGICPAYVKRIISKNHMGLCVFTKYLGHNGIVGELLERQLRTDLTLKQNP